MGTNDLRGSATGWKGFQSEPRMVGEILQSDLEPGCLWHRSGAEQLDPHCHCIPYDLEDPNGKCSHCSIGIYLFGTHYRGRRISSVEERNVYTV